MRDIIKLFVKHSFTIVFLLLEILAFSLMVMHNNYQRTIFFNQTASIFGTISSTISNVKEYFSLKEKNEKLVSENTNMKNQIETLKSMIYQLSDSSTCIFDSTNIRYKFISAQIINASFNKTKNYITINKGYHNGIKQEMAVISNEGIIGIVEKNSKHYSRVLPLINIESRISAKIKKNGYYGSLQWDGKDYRYSYLNDIPFHVNIATGDTIVTSGFSSIFPEGELIGFVESVNKQTANFLSIKVKLAVDFKKIFDVYVITNKHQQELQELEVKEL